MTALKSLFFLIFVPGLFIIFIPFNYLTFGPALQAGLLTWFALPLWLIGGLMILWCFWDFLVKGKGTPAPIDPPKKLVVSGLYRFVRNPMYVGVELCLLGNFLWFGFWSMLAYMIFFFVAFHVFVLVYEEPNLRKKFGTAYEDYCRRVPRWIPEISSISRLSLLKQYAHALKAEALALYFAVRDPRTPWYAKALAAFVVAHTFSPIDLIPDFIPVLGLLDDIIITPAGIWLALRLILLPVMQEAREKARARISEAKPVSWTGAALIVVIWLALATLSVILILRAV